MELKYINNSGYFGIKYLDAALHGIKPNDLILIGASSGAGKTELCTHIAKTNAKLGKRVRYIALEAEKNEIETTLHQHHTYLIASVTTLKGQPQ